MRDPKATQGPISRLLPLANAICKGLGAKQRVLMSVAKTARAKLERLRLKLSGTTLLQKILNSADDEAAQWVSNTFSF